MKAPELKNKEWKSFFIEDIFDIKGGKSVTKQDAIIGTIPYISASAENNSISNFIGNKNVGSEDKNFLSVTSNGSVCEAFYQPFNCIVSGDVKRLHLKNYDSKEVYLFMAAIIRRQKEKYSYGYKFGEKRMIRQKILLPVNDSGDPDYEYMEQYIKNMMQDKLIDYIAHIS